MAPSPPAATSTSSPRTKTSDVHYYAGRGSGKHKLWLNFTSSTGRRSVRKTSARFDTGEETFDVHCYAERGSGKHKLWLNLTSSTGHRSVRKTSARFGTGEDTLAASDAFRASWQYSVRGKAASADTVHSLLGSTPAEEIAVLPSGKFGTVCVFADIKF